MLGQPSIWNIGLEMRTGLSDYGLSSRIVGEEDLSRNTVFLGLYEDSRAVSQYLQAAGISADDVLSLPFAPELDREDTSIILLHRDRDRYVLVILADKPAVLSEALGTLFNGTFRNQLLNDNLGLSKVNE